MSAGNYTLITGASSGIGLELAKLFASINHNLILVSRDESQLEAVKTELGQLTSGEILCIPIDLFDPSAPEKLYNDVRDRGLTVDVLVNDAGQGQYGKFADGELPRFLDIIHLNIYALTALSHFFLQDMIARNEGKILNLASIASKTPGPWQAVYHASKAYVLSLSEALVNELQDTDITVTALQPGVTNTDFFNKAEMQDSKAVQDPSKMADPAKVAKDGFDALMKGKDKVVSGAKNKFQTALGNIIPDSTVAEQVNKQQQPVGSES